MLRIVPIFNNDRYTHLIDGKLDGKRKRIFFASEKEAKTELKRLENQLRQEGEKGLSLADTDRVLAVEAAELLRPFNKTVLDAARFYVGHLAAMTNDVRIAYLIDLYIASKRAAKFSQVYLDDIEQRLSRFGDFFGTRALRSVTAGEIEQWLHGLGLSPQSVNNYRSVTRAFYSFAVKRKHLESNPVAAIDKIRSVNKAPEIFLPELLATVLTKAPATLLPVLTIGAFAGLRTSELLR